MQTAGDTSNLPCSSRQLLRRLNGLQPKQWNLNVDQGLLEYLEAAYSLEALHEFSGNILKMTQHILDISKHEGMQQYSLQLPYIIRPLYPVLS
jgi:hypothetical protein